ncbi:MAG: MATE family efflux transporter [Methanosarcinaceae archaeon]|nr:MATE family efflux transporter [Methanosarcinaceae archaeon]
MGRKGSNAESEDKIYEKKFEETKGVRELLGNQKKALIKLSIPVILTLLFQSSYNIVNTFWVAGLGDEALAAVGVAFPIYMIVVGIAMGIGTGASAGISRAIGERNRTKANQIATHGIVLAVLLSFVSFVYMPFTGKVFELMGTDPSLTSVATSYTNITLAASIFIFVSSVGNSIMRGEGDTKRPMYAIAFGAILNVILDPFFIYDFGLGLGVDGAAYAGALSMAISCIAFIYWLLIKKDTFVQIDLRNFKFKKDILKEILVVGVPASFTQFTMSISSILLNATVLLIGGTVGASIFTTGWKIVSIGIIPTQGLAIAMITLAGVSYGEKNIPKLRDLYKYSIKLGIGIEFIIGLIFFVFAGQISYIFTAINGSVELHDGLTMFLKIMVFFYVMIPVNVITSSIFQGVRLGNLSLFTTIIRSILEVPFAFVLGYVLGYGLIGVWIGMLIGDLIVVTVSYTLGTYVINSLERVYKNPNI